MNSPKQDILQPENTVLTAKATILVVEDELIIAGFLRRALEKSNYSVVHAISYEAAIGAIKQRPPDAALLDIRLGGPRTGIDVARYLSTLPAAPPFIYLTSQLDEPTLDLAKTTRPAAYLGKPIRLPSLLSTLEVTLFNARTTRKEAPLLELRHDGMTHRIPVQDIDYLQSEGMYVRVHLAEGRSLLQRGTLATMLDMMDSQRFAQAHRSFAINLDRVTAYCNTAVQVGEVRIPISRNRRREVHRLLGQATGSGLATDVRNEEAND